MDDAGVDLPAARAAMREAGSAAWPSSAPDPLPGRDDPLRAVFAPKALAEPPHDLRMPDCSPALMGGRDRTGPPPTRGVVAGMPAEAAAAEDGPKPAALPLPWRSLQLSATSCPDEKTHTVWEAPKMCTYCGYNRLQT